MAKRKVEVYRHRSLGLKILIQTAKMLFFLFLSYESVSSLLITGFQAGSNSMNPAITADERILVARIPYGMVIPLSNHALPPFRGPRHGEVVLLQNPLSSRPHIPILSDLADFLALGRIFPGDRFNFLRPSYSVRRVIALPGDRVYLSGGVAYVQIGGTGDFIAEGLISVEEYQLLLPADSLNQPDSLLPFHTQSITVAEGELFVMPDDRVRALGSSAWGPTPVSRLRGRVLSSF